MKGSKRLLLAYYCSMSVGLVLCSSTAHAFIYITTLYNEKSDDRIAEYIECLEKNLAHPLIERVHVLYDTAKDDRENKLLRYLQTKPLTLSFITGRPTYGSCFDVANALYPHKKVIVSNADIYFNHTLALLGRHDFTNTFVALTRWNIKKDGTLRLFKQYSSDGKFLPTTSAMSQDVWIFQPPLVKFEKDDIALGTMTCDSLIAYQAFKANLKVINPCLSVQALHLHMSNIRNYNPRIIGKGPIKQVPWTGLAGAQSIQEQPSHIQQLKKQDTYLPVAHCPASLSLKITQDSQFFATLAHAFKAPLCLKVGDTHSDFISKAAPFFKSVHSIEKDQSLSRYLKKEVTSSSGTTDTAHKNRQLIIFDNQPTVHYGPKTVKQLEAWAQSNKPNKAPTALVINNINLLDKYTLKKIVTALKTAHNNYKVAVTGNNMLVAYTPHFSIQVSPVMRACTLSRFYDGKNFSFKDIIQAEGIIASAQNGELEALKTMRAQYPSAYYYLWNGLTLLKQEKYAAAHQEFLAAYNQGLKDWRVQWYLARSAPKT